MRLFDRFKKEMLNTFENKMDQKIVNLKLNVSKNFIIEEKTNE